MIRLVILETHHQLLGGAVGHRAHMMGDVVVLLPGRAWAHEQRAAQTLCRGSVLRSAIETALHERLHAQGVAGEEDVCTSSLMSPCCVQEGGEGGRGGGGRDQVGVIEAISQSGTELGEV